MSFNAASTCLTRLSIRDGALAVLSVIAAADRNV